MYWKDAFLKVAEKKAPTSGGGHLGLGVLLQQKPGLGRGGLSPSRDHTQPAWPCHRWHVLEELTGSGDVPSGGCC